MPATIKLENMIKISNVGNIAIFSVIKGALKPKMKTKIGKNAVTVKSIELNREKVKEAIPGKTYGALLDGSHFNILQELKGKTLEFK